MNAQKQLIVMITGAGKNPGKATALHLANTGAAAAIVDVSPVPLEVLEQQILARQGICKTYTCDMAKKRFVQGTLEQVLEDFGALDAVVLAGFVDPADSLYSLDEWDWQRAMEVNLSGVFYTLQSYARITREQPGGGSAVVIISGRSHPVLNICARALRGLLIETCREFASLNLRIHAVQKEGMTDDEISSHINCLLLDPEKSGVLITRKGEVPLDGLEAYIP
jgi:NAD(P)-dependent dehydrogenase (short-subunit alcohol dehydrogenase family)